VPSFNDKPQRLDFHAWLSGQRLRPDGVGDLARRYATAGGKCWRTPRALLKHLFNSNGVPKTEWQALALARGEYENYRDATKLYNRLTAETARECRRTPSPYRDVCAVAKAYQRMIEKTSR
jgi:hypothetical protein